jgi:hypothetical protein
VELHDQNKRRGILFAMKSNEQTAAFGIGIAATILFTALLIAAKIGPAIYAGLITVTMLACVAIAALPRLLELNLKEMKLLLSQAEKVKAEFQAMYGTIEHETRTNSDGRHQV